MTRRPPRPTRTDTLFPDTPLFRSQARRAARSVRDPRRVRAQEPGARRRPAGAARGAGPVARRRLPHRPAPAGVGLRRCRPTPADAPGPPRARFAPFYARHGTHTTPHASLPRPTSIPLATAHGLAVAHEHPHRTHARRQPTGHRPRVSR